jgi:hypothetical protein
MILKILVQSGLRNNSKVSFFRDFFSAHEIKEMHRSQENCVAKQRKHVCSISSASWLRSIVSNVPHIYTTQYLKFRGIK